MSNRELEVVRGVFNGGTELSIAKELKLSVHTVHSHFDRLYKKLGIKSRCALAVRVFAEYLRLQPLEPSCRRPPRRKSHLACRTASTV